jgi:hypothetical protein
MVHHSDFIKVEYRVELVRDSDNGMGCELCPQQLLDMSIRDAVNTILALVASRRKFQSGGLREHMEK